MRLAVRHSALVASAQPDRCAGAACYPHTTQEASLEIGALNVMFGNPRSMRRLIPTCGLVLVASLVLGGAAAGSASASPGWPSWYSCQQGPGKGQPFQDSECSKQSAEGTFRWTELTSPISFSMHNVTNFTLTVPIFTSIISCSSLTSEGTLENHLNSAGTISEPNFTLSGCAVSKPSGCVVPSTIPLNKLKGEAIQSGSQYGVKFSPLNKAGELATFTISSCGVLNGSKTLKGSFTGLPNSSPSSLEFTAASSNVTFGGQPGSFVGNAKMETGAGQVLKIED